MWKPDKKTAGDWFQAVLILILKGILFLVGGFYEI